MKNNYNQNNSRNNNQIDTYKTGKIINLVIYALLAISLIRWIVPMAYGGNMVGELVLSIVGLIITIAVLKSDYLFDILILGAILLQLVPTVGFVAGIIGFVLCIIKIINLAQTL